MSGFAAEWLALREPADRQARNRRLRDRLALRFRDAEQITVLDLGAGTGSTLRALAPVLARNQHWILTDNDAALLELARAPSPEITLETIATDLSTALEALFAPVPDIVTTSAFLDLCGADWLERLAHAVADCGAAFYAALSYTGDEAWSPADPLDGPVHAAFISDQGRDKGFGPSLGAEAHGHLVQRFAEAGYSVHEGRSDWQLRGGRDRALIAALADGIAEAAARNGVTREQANAWAKRRHAAKQVEIGHADLLALPPERRWEPLDQIVGKTREWRAPRPSTGRGARP